MDTPVKNSRGNAVLVVLGDFGQSPRMCYHALSLANHGMSVQIVGYEGMKPHEQIASHSRIKLVPVKPMPRDLLPKICPTFLQNSIKFLWMLCMTFYSLFFFTQTAASLLLMQNPPGLPTMLLCYLAAKWKSAAFVIDWHNYTHSLLELQSLSDASQSGFRFSEKLLKLNVLIAGWWEGVFGRTAHWSLCVSRAMRKDLKRRWSIKALVLRDKSPAWMFRPLSVEEQHNFLNRLMKTDKFAVLDQWRAKDLEIDGGSTEVNMFSCKNPSGSVRFLVPRPMLLVSSTSWTEDEDFDMLLEALTEYDKEAQKSRALNEESHSTLPNLLMVITGEGLKRQFYEDMIANMELQMVRIVTTWLSAEDYPKMLACSNLGVSVHASSSGLDLPMKIVDMFGCHLPVLAKTYRAIPELVQDRVNGLCFENSLQLKESLVKLAKGFPLCSKELNLLKNGFKETSRTTWEKQWNKSVWPLVQSLLPPHPFDDKHAGPLKIADETIDEMPEEQEN